MPKTPEEIIEELGSEAKKSSYILAQTPTDKINEILNDLACALLLNKEYILAENNKDLSAAKQSKLSPALLDRLSLDNDRIKAIARSVEIVAKSDDPTNKILWETMRPNGLKIQRVSCPIGVLGMIYESRPNVTIDAAILSLKSHNAVILRGGSESMNSSLALHKIIQDILEKHKIPKACVSMVPTKDRDAVGAMLRADKYIDIIIPRGGYNLTNRVMEEARMPVFGHLDGLCHIYIHSSADPEIAKDVTLNAKMRRTGICGAMETLLLDINLDKSIATNILINILDSGCNIVGDEQVQALDDRIGTATLEDWRTEYLDAKLSCRMIDNIEDAVSYINKYGSHHTDCIISQDDKATQYFQHNVDSGIVMHNASTQFADGGEFGMGAEIGIATGKMHARGPVGLEQLCTYKYLVHGNGQTRA